MIKAILLDIDDTILDWQFCSHESARLAAEELNIELPSNFYEVFDEVNQSLWDRLQNNEIDIEVLKKLRFKTIFDRFNITLDTKLFEDLFRKNVLSSTIEEKGARDILEYLYSKYYVFAASNSDLYRQVKRLSNCGLLDYFNDIFVSQEIGYSKPSKEFFLECIRRSRFEKDEIIVIGDSLSSDIKGANNANLKSIWYNKNKKDANHDATYMVYDLAEIKRIL